MFLARFEREAKVLASLNHPNIAAIYGLEEAEGVRPLVLELVEGPTLAERIARGLLRPSIQSGARPKKRMPLQPGTTLGPYAVAAGIGEGGEVYRVAASS